MTSLERRAVGVGSGQLTDGSVSTTYQLPHTGCRLAKAFAGSGLEVSKSIVI